jgi:hypothetical protein
LWCVVASLAVMVCADEMTILSFFWFVVRFRV